MFSKNKNRTYFKQQWKRRSRSLNLSKSDFYKNNECTHQSSIINKKCTKRNTDPCAPDSKRLKISYKGLLQKIAADLKKLRLNERFHCLQNNSTTLMFQILLLFIIIILNF